MSGRASEGKGAMSDLPWASVFDPAINVHALGEIQARGFRAATDLVDRFVRSAEPSAGAGAGAGAGDRDAQDSQDSQEEPAAILAGSVDRPNADQLLSSWKGMLGQLVAAMTPGAESSAVDRPSVDLVNHSASGCVRFVADIAGSVSSEIWLHNGGPVDLGKIRLRCSDLMSHDGSVIPAAAVRFELDAIPLPARSSRGVIVEVDVPIDKVAGVYRGSVFADGHPEVWLPISLNVTSRLP